ncbi:MAG: acetolactate decarboxylase [Deltaproteobacteria bacterium]|nr:acetolactate decarboxylase [Deltaproteobacteria bacterium]
MQSRRALVLALCLAFCLAAGPLHAAEPRRIFQTSTLQALMAGLYDGDLTFQALARHGDFGLGTFDALDGEMIALDGTFYQIKADGRVYPVTGSMTTPFAEVTFFKAGRTHMVEMPVNFQQLLDYVDRLLPSPNLPYAIRIDGFFTSVKTRSIPRQQKPYPPLAAAAEKQAVFELANVKGVIVAFRHPAYLAGVNMPGYHCHFITADRRAGGHLLDCRVEGATVAVDARPNFCLRLPDSQEFLQSDLTGDRRHELEKIER